MIASLISVKKATNPGLSIDQEQADHADGDAGDFGDADLLFIDQIADEQKPHSHEAGLDDVSGVDFAAIW